MNLNIINNFDYISSLLVQKSNINLIKYNLFIKYIINNAKLPEHKILALQIYNNSKSVPSGALAAVFSDPSFSYWIYLSTCLKNRLENNEDIPTTDLPYYTGISNPDSDKILEYHLIECNRFIIAAAILSRTEILGEILFLENAFYLPILGLHIINIGNGSKYSASYTIEDGKSVLMIGDYHKYILDEALYISESGFTKKENSGNILIQPSILGSAGRIIIDRIDPYIRMGWSMTYKNPDGSRYLQLDQDELDIAMPVVLKSFKLIKESWPEMAMNISATIRKIHLVRSPNPDLHMSCSNERFFGSILISTGNEHQLAEAFVHEYSHNILDMIISTGDVFEGTVPSDEIYYSPWRNDKRHISGVLHAVFVFSNVSILLERMSKTDTSEYVNLRKLDNLVRLVMGMEVLKTYPFSTPLANNLLLDLERNIDSLKALYFDIDFSDSIELQNHHLKSWIKTYGNNNLPINLQNFSYWSK
jgi:hypothetical protein